MFADELKLAHMKSVFGAPRSECWACALMTNSLVVLRELNLKISRSAPSLVARQKVQPHRLPGVLKIDLVNHDAGDCESLYLMVADILPRT